MKTRLPITAFIIVLLVFGITPGFGADYATILKTQNTNLYQRGQRISIGMRLATQQDQRIAFRNTAGDVIVLGSNSQITITKPNLIKQFFGKVFYFFTPRPDNETQVQTLTATIGVRGTQFLVTTSESEDNDLISLETGLLNVASPDDEPFKVHTRKPLSEFEKYKQETEAGVEQINEEFEAYKQQVDQEFIEYKKSVLLSPGKTLRIAGRDLFTVDLPPEQQNEIDSLKAFIADVTN